MRILKITLVSLAVLIAVLVAAVFIFINTFDVNRFKPQIISQAKSALNREVNFDKIRLGLSLTQGVTVKISDLTIAEDQAFGQGDFLKVKDISLGVNAFAYILGKKIDIPSVVIDSPRLSIIRQKDGTLNITSFSKQAEATANGQKPAQAPSPLAIPAVLVSSLKLENGTLLYIDRSFEPPVSLEASDLSVSLSKISLNEPFGFSVEAAVLSPKKNIRIQGKAQLDLNTQEVTVSDLKLETELSDILPAKITQAFPMTKGAVLPQAMKGKFELVLEKITAGPKGLTALASNASLSEGFLQFKEIASPVKDLTVNAVVTDKDINAQKISAGIGEGSLTGSGKLNDYSVKQDFSLEAEIRGLKVQDLVPQEKSAVKMEGVVSGPVKLSGRGFSGDAINSNLLGQADISVTKAKLKDINVLRTVLDKISVIPGLSQKVESGLPENYKQKLTQKDTDLNDIKLSAAIEHGRILVKDAVLGAQEFTFKGQVEAGFDGAYSLEGSFLIPSDLSQAIVAQVSEMQYLLNEDKQIYIPLKISGKAPEIKFKVDAEYIGKKLIMNQGEQQLLKAINKALGSKEDNAADQNAGQSGTNAEGSVGDLLRNIFKKNQQ
ncbi:MAG: AsmA family protein [Candidatus Omnitrophica bacterium]|nr:AsmA family protein [Candidatus Omnitrophota bacterium]